MWDNEMQALQEAFEWCDHLLIGAGAGLSAAAGLSFADEVLFQQRYPLLFEQGIHSDYQTFSYRGWDAPTYWGYFADHLHRVLEETPPLPLYHTLLALVSQKDFFVITSNVDRQFLRTGFPPERLFEYQGSFAYLACKERCSDAVWPTGPHVTRLRAHTDPATMQVSAEALPTCPQCGAALQYAGRAVPGYDEAQERYRTWLEKSAAGRTCIMEIGVGFNSAGIIRVPFERIVGERPAEIVRFFRITADYPDNTIEIAYPEIPQPIADKSTSINLDAAVVLETLYKRCFNKTGVQS